MDALGQAIESLIQEKKYSEEFLQDNKLIIKYLPSLIINKENIF